MTKRSILIGVLCAVLLSVVTYFNDMVMRGTFLVGNYLPVAVFGTLILFLLLINPLLRKLSRHFALSGRELAVIVTLVLFACYLPGRGLLHFFSTAIMLPHHHLRTKPSWQSEPAAVTHQDVIDWQRMERVLGSANAPPALAALRRGMGRARTGGRKDGRTGGWENGEGSTEDRHWGMLSGLNRAIEESAFGLEPGVTEGLTLTRHVRDLLAREPGARSDTDRQTINRGVVDALLAGAVVPHRLGPVARAPARMLADVSQDSTRVLDGFVTGLAQGEEKLAYRDVPWRAWVRPLLFWMPLILTVCAMVVGLGLVLHRQWATHEHLPYPTVEFARSLLPDDDSGWSPVMRSRLFWLGATVVLAIHMNNYACVWWPDNLIPIKTRLECRVEERRA